MQVYTNLIQVYTCIDLYIIYTRVYIYVRLYNEWKVVESAQFLMYGVEGTKVPLVPHFRLLSGDPHKNDFRPWAPGPGPGPWVPGPDVQRYKKWGVNPRRVF